MITQLLGNNINRVLGFGVGWFSGYYLSTFALLTLSVIGGIQIYWIYNHETVNRLNSGSNNTHDNTQSQYWNNIRTILFTNASYFPVGYIVGIVCQKLKLWILVLGIGGGYIIGYHYTPMELEYKLTQFWLDNRGAFYNMIGNSYNIFHRVVHDVLTELDRRRYGD